MTQPATATARHHRAMIVTLAVTLGYAAVQAAAGWLTNSLSLLADSGHMVTDASGLALALFASWVAKRPANAAKTYGYYRAEILAALLNGMVMFGLSAFIFYEAYRRFWDPPPVQGWPMLIVASLGLGVNLFGIWNLHGAAGESLNVRAAFLEVLGDTLGSVGTIAAGIIVLTTCWRYADPLFSALIAVLILPRTCEVITQAVNVLLEACPAHINVAAVERAMRNLSGVAAVHDLHIWTITSGIEACSAHVVLVQDCSAETCFDLVDRLHELLKSEFGIAHTTIQVERCDRREREMCR